jgi:hypothetical protein
MGRSISGPKPGEIREYVPRAFGNDKDADPVKVWIRNPTAREKREVMSIGGKSRVAIGTDGRPALNKDGMPMVEVDTPESWIHQHEMVTRFVEKTENYKGPGGLPIGNGSDLAMHGETEIVSEVAVEIQSALSLTLDEKKTLPLPHGSSSEGSWQLAGIVGNVESPGFGKAAAATDERNQDS